MSVSIAIRTLAAEKGIALGDLAERSGMRRRQTFSEKLNGHSEFTVSELIRIAESLDVSPQDIFSTAEREVTR